MDADDYMAEFVRWLEQDGDQDQPSAGEFSIAGRLLGDPGDPEDLIGAETSLLVEEILRQLALLGPPQWEWLRAEFAFTVSAEIAHLRFSSGHRPVAVAVPESVAALVRDQRRTAALMPAGPWWRLLLTLTDRSEATVDYDFGEGPFPHDQLLPPEHYRNDLEAYPRARVAPWLVRYITGPDEPDDSSF